MAKRQKKQMLDALREIWLLVSLYLIIMPPGLFAGYHGFLFYSRCFSIDLDAPGLSIHLIPALICFCIGLVLGMYAGVVLWLVLGRYVLRFTKREVTGVCKMGPHTKWDIKLIELVYR